MMINDDGQTLGTPPSLEKKGSCQLHNEVAGGDAVSHALRTLFRLWDRGEIDPSLFAGLAQKVVSPCGLCGWEAALEIYELADWVGAVRSADYVRARLCERHSRWSYGVAQAAHQRHFEPIRILDGRACRAEVNPLSLTWRVLDASNNLKDRAAEELEAVLRDRCPLCRQRARSILFVHSGGEIDAPDDARWDLDDFCGAHREELEAAAGSWKHAARVRPGAKAKPMEPEAVAPSADAEVSSALPPSGSAPCPASHSEEAGMPHLGLDDSALKERDARVEAKLNSGCFFCQIEGSLEYYGGNGGPPKQRIRPVELTELCGRHDEWCYAVLDEAWVHDAEPRWFSEPPNADSGIKRLVGN